METEVSGAWDLNKPATPPKSYVTMASTLVEIGSSNWKGTITDVHFTLW
jgi:hypothetical protein